MDGNVVRVLSRYFCIEEEVDAGKTQKQIWALAEEILPEEEPWVAVEGLIELGATVCGKDPKCFLCPLQAGCQGLKRGMVDILPKKRKKPKITQLFRQVLIVVCRGKVLLRRGKWGEVMAGLYEFPYFEGEEGELGGWMGRVFPFPLVFKGALPPVQHTFTRYRATLFPGVWEGNSFEDIPEYEWVEMDRIREYPFSSGHRKIIENLRG